MNNQRRLLKCESETTRFMESNIGRIQAFGKEFTALGCVNTSDLGATSS